MSFQAVKTQKNTDLPLISTDDTDLKEQNLTADKRGLPRIEKRLNVKIGYEEFDYTKVDSMISTAQYKHQF